MSHMDRLKQWVSMGIALLVLGIILHFSHAMPLNKQLYTFTYICVTAGAAGIVFSLFYFLVDILNLLYPFMPLQWIGMNAMLVYVMAAEGIFEGFLNGWFYKGTNTHWCTGSGSMCSSECGTQPGWASSSTSSSRRSCSGLSSPGYSTALGFTGSCRQHRAR